MADFDTGRTLAERFRRHAGSDTHLYGHLMRRMADDLDGGGPVAAVCRGYEDVPVGAAVQLRILAAVFRLVLTGRADELLPYYPVLGGTADPASAWPVFREVLAEHADEVHAALAVAPQTNEVGRSAALLAGLGFLRTRGLPLEIDLVELGASAGLNLLLPHYLLSGERWRWGDPASPLHLTGAIEGAFAAPEIRIARAVGCDVAPIDLTDPDQVLWLRSFVWPFSPARHARLDAALAVAREHPPRVERGSADDWLPGIVETSAMPVVWHSITRQYWPAGVTARVERELADHGARHRCARIWLEYVPGERMPLLGVDLWDGAGGWEREVLGTVHPHGVPVRLTGAAG
ncbi:DUF2332 domain-containing protein [Propionicicella superfundia]|uniref:DUF2332 domain-containing protein n=1 Tax=Propionicicella superfundia TaxID=348582 RepID=UPI0003F50F09|nr:DUF2332 domain-containing protein [Propionicicella superfundia]